MIINFSVKNFRSIKDEITIEFNASSDKDHINFVTETKYCNILNANAIYGYYHSVELSNGEIGHIEKSEHWRFL